MSVTLRFIILIVAASVLSNVKLPWLLGGEDRDAVFAIAETEETPFPSYVLGALQKLAEEDPDLEWGAFDDDAPQDGRRKTAADAARENGLPALVTMSGDEVEEAMDLPPSFEAIIEAGK